ncbi:MAG TPA: nucleotide exchange factor GrpE [Ktedonobacterales bacterium]|nr:nucleotide exchange factor GrpE [Ktedonobacterales bacterium]
MSEEEQIPGVAPQADDDTQAGAPLDAQVDAQTDARSDAPIKTEGSADERIAALERQLAAERDAATEYMQRWQRSAADFTNYKRRFQQEQEQRERLLAAQALAPVLNALDSFERAFSTLPDSLRGYTWIEGVALVDYQLRRALDAQGIAETPAEVGQPFDPAHHQAVGEVETDQHPDGHIAVLLQRGYEVAGVLLRPALVQLARTPTAPDATQSQAAESQTTEESGTPAAPEEIQPSGPAP